MLPGPGAAGQVRDWVMYGAVFLPARINLDRGYSGFHREHRNKEPSPDHPSWGGEGLLQQPVCGLLAPPWQFVESAFQTSAVADEGNGVNGLKEDLGVSKYTLLLRR